MMATMPTTSAISEERFLSEVSSKLDEITYVFAPKLPGSLQAKGAIQGDRDRPRQHIPTPPVDHRHQVDKPLAQTDIGDIGAPHMVHPLDLHAPQEIRINHMSCERLAQVRLRVDGFNTHLPHQPGHPLSIDSIALAAQPGGHATTPIKRSCRVLRIEQPHEMQIVCAFSYGLEVQA